MKIPGAGKVAAALEEKHGIKITRQAVGQYLSGKHGSKYAALIDKVYTELLDQAVRELEKKINTHKTII